MTRLLSSPITYVVLVLFFLASFLFLLAILHLRQARRGPYWRLRKVAGQRGGQLFLFALSLYGLMGAVIFFSGFGAFVVREVNLYLTGTPEDFLPGMALPTRTFTPNFPTPDVAGTVDALLTASIEAVTLPAGTATAAPQNGSSVPLTPRPTDGPATLTPGSTPTATLSPTPSASSTPTPTPTATFDFVLSFTPPPSTIQPQADAALAILQAAESVTADGTALNAGDAFPVGIQRLYFFVGYENLENGLVWSRVLYREDIPVQGGEYSWSQGASGSSYFFFGRDDGYPAGNYEIRLFLGEEEVSRFAFTIVAPTATPAP